MEDQKINEITKLTIEVSLRVGVLFLLLIWCLLILLPFSTAVIWGIIIAVAIAPIYHLFQKKLGASNKLSATLLVLFFIAILIIPSFFLVSSLVESFKVLGQALQDKSLHLPPPQESIADWPLVGKDLYKLWLDGHENLDAVLKKYEDQLAALGKWMLNQALGVGKSVLLFIISIVIAGGLLATKGTQSFTQKFFGKLVGEKQSEEFTRLAEVTIGNVTKGIIGVAFIQSTLLGVIFLFAKIPFAGLWALVCLILSIIQIGPGLVALGVIIYLFSTQTATYATIWTVIIFIATLSDNVLKPIFLGKGAPVPMLIIFLGAIGGFILSGFLGLFTGAIVLSLGFKLFIAWIEGEAQSNQKTE
ncbi:AI-2E family transporter [Sediminitomix flava]|uniref:Putative PurR-regulated permease PerM n=1 Tax=Sediminitomix flava TaxID=379075 RepID=A0A315ZGD8_SEDFL|nr:AI-2E family transporter [Sediminitomix flava]PWJ44656.1 putative PurR-regulated permease PerM [Sediminitomix flava]